jgi:hypothetical protein
MIYFRKKQRDRYFVYLSSSGVSGLSVGTTIEASRNLVRPDSFDLIYYSYPNNATFMLGYYKKIELCSVRDFTPLQFHEIVSKLIHKMSRASFLKLNNECDFR